MAFTPILLYHQISDLSPDHDPQRLATPPALFEAQLKLLKDEGYQTVRLEDLIACWIAEKPLPPKTVVITFDDGYRDNYDVALPLLTRYGFTATNFLVADRIGGVANWEGQRTPVPMMSWQQVREWHESGMSLGSHTLTYPDLRLLPADKVAYEIVTSRAIIEDHIGAPVVTISYPYESFSRKVLHMVEACGYQGACGSPAMPETIFNLWRAECYGSTTMEQFRWKITSWHNDYLWGRYRSPLRVAARRVNRIVKSLRVKG